MVDSEVLRCEFRKYLKDKNLDINLLNSVVRYSSNIFDIFCYGVKCKEEYDNQTGFMSDDGIFAKHVSKRIKEEKGIVWMRKETYNKIKTLFKYFISFCKENKKIFNLYFLEQNQLNFEKYLSGNINEDISQFIIARHDCIKNNNGKNGDKLRENLLDVYNKIGVDNYGKLLKFYICFFQAFSKFSEINNDKGNVGGKKENAFYTSCKILYNELSNIGIKINEGCVMSLFGKYLNFVHDYSNKISENLWSQLVKELYKLKGSIISEISLNFWDGKIDCRGVEWDEYGEKSRDPHGNYDIIGGEVKPPEDYNGQKI